MASKPRMINVVLHGPDCQFYFHCLDEWEVQSHRFTMAQRLGVTHDRIKVQYVD